MHDAPGDRIAGLERRLVRLRMLCWLGLVVATGSFAWALRTEPGGVTDGRLWLARDEAGRVRGMFGVTNDAVALTMYDSTGQLRLDVGLAPNAAPGMLMRSAGGDPVAMVTVNDAGIPIVRLTNGAERLRLEVAPRPGATVVVTGAANRPDTILRGDRR